MTYATAPVTDEKLNAFVEGAESKIAAYFAKYLANLEPTKLTLEKGKRFVRVVANDRGQGRSAWAFVEIETGLILKPASWKVPAKHARGTIHTETNGVEFVGPHGPAYLR